MSETGTQRSGRPPTPLTTAHLVELGKLADVQHERYTRSAVLGGTLEAWADRRVGVVLAQSAALHYLHPDAGQQVNDLDVWTFYAAMPGRSLRSQRQESRSVDGTTGGPHYAAIPLAGRVRGWKEYDGKRVDFLVREIDVHPGAGASAVIAALRSWLGHGARQPCRHEEHKNSSAHWLAHTAMVWIGTPANRDEAGRTVWDGTT